MSEIDTETKVLGLIGNPVKDSLSPKFQNLALEKLDLNYRYFAFPAEKEKVAPVVRGARDLGVAGLNVTVPHKERVGELLDELSRSAGTIEAVNTIVFQSDGSLKGENTDWLGFIRSLELNDFNPEGKDCLVFGAGGGAAGVIYGLIREGADRIVIVNRTEARARSMVRRMSGISPGVDLDARPLSGYDLGRRVEEADLVVNATSVGMGDTSGQAIWEEAENFGSEQLVYDLVYNPYPTKFLELAGNAGAKTVDGLDMLILQGLESLKLWTGEEFDTEPLVDDLRKKLRG